MLENFQGYGGYLQDSSTVFQKQIEEKFNFLRYDVSNAIESISKFTSNLNDLINELTSFNSWYIYHCPMHIKLVSLFKRNRQIYLSKHYEKWKHNS